MEAGFGRTDITPRVGVELSGFGPYLNRHSIAVRDRLWARAMAVREGGTTLVLAACDLIGISSEITRRVRMLVRQATGLPDDAIMVHCTHTHSGPATRTGLIGWGDPDPPYMELLPRRIARACVDAVRDLSESVCRHAEVPCEGIGLNREYDRDAPPLEEVLAESWRPAKPELTDTSCHVVAVEKRGKLAGFFSSFGCHPVVCCAASRHIHGDFCGVATNMVERENPGATGLFLQGAQGDVNSCVVHKGEEESLRALDVVAERYARAVRTGLSVAEPFECAPVAFARRRVTFGRKSIDLDRLRRWLAEKEAVLAAADARDEDYDVRMAKVYVTALRRLIARKERGESLEPPAELQAFRLGPLGITAAPFEVFQGIKNDFVTAASAPIPLLVGLTNDLQGYAPDREVAARGGYATDQVPIMLGELPFAEIHDELVRVLLDLDATLFDRP